MDRKDLLALLIFAVVARSTREYNALRKLAEGGRPLVRRHGGYWLAFGIDYCCYDSGLSKGRLIDELAWRMGVTRDQIYTVLRKEVGWPPDKLWRAGRGLRELGVSWMSGPLALATEPLYEAHLLGVIGELLLEPMSIAWHGVLYDFLQSRSLYRSRSEFGIECLRRAGYWALPLDQFEAAWQRWYAFDPLEFAIKERAARFAKLAPPLARAVSLLRAQQRDRESNPDAQSYEIALADANKDILEYFSPRGFLAQPPHASSRYVVAESPRINLLSDEAYGTTTFGKLLRNLIAPGGKPVTPLEAYRSGPDLRIQGSSGLLYLVMLGYEREYYLLVARILARGIRGDDKQPFLPMYRRLLEQEQTAGDIQELLLYKSWWKALLMISCLIGPYTRSLDLDSEDFGPSLTVKLAGLRESVDDIRASDLHKAIFEESTLATELRQIMTLPDQKTNDIIGQLSRFSIPTAYDPSDYTTFSTPTELATVLDMLHRQDFAFPPDDVRIELVWWIRDVARKLKAL